MNKQPFLKKIKPLLTKLRIFGFLYFIYFFVARIKNRLVNNTNKITRKTVLVLLYHRVGRVFDDPVKLVVAPNTFEEHIKYINKFYKPISLDELVKRLNSKSLTGNEVCVTFDDGYKDNLTNALPILEKYNTPATIFITTSNIGKRASFDWDMKYSEEDRAVFLSEDEIKMLANHPLIEIGAHTHNHLRLSDLSKERQLSEIETSKKNIEEIIGKKVLHFAYPFGLKQDFNENSKDLVKELGFISAYENTELLGTASSDIYSFPRINIRECDTRLLAKKLYN